MESLGSKIRQQRRHLGLTLDEVSGRTSISKPYLSLIETGRVSNPASDDKLRRIEQALGFAAGELITQAHLYRTPRDVRAVLHKLMASDENIAASSNASEKKFSPARQTRRKDAAPAGGTAPKSGEPSDPEHLTGVFREYVNNSAGQFGPLAGNAVPVINRESTAYPRGFSGLDYPRQVAEAYVSCPDVNDEQAFAARVQGDSMTPKYREGDIVIFSPAQTARDGDDCFIRYADGQTAFQRVFFESSDGHQPMIRLQPRNERHRAQTVPSDKIAGMYKAVYRYQKVEDD